MAATKQIYLGRDTRATLASLTSKLKEMNVSQSEILRAATQFLEKEIDKGNVTPSVLEQRGERFLHFELNQ